MVLVNSVLRTVMVEWGGKLIVALAANRCLGAGGLPGLLTTWPQEKSMTLYMSRFCRQVRRISEKERERSKVEAQVLVITGWQTISLVIMTVLADVASSWYIMTITKPKMIYSCVGTCHRRPVVHVNTIWQPTVARADPGKLMPASTCTWCSLTVNFIGIINSDLSSGY